MGTLRSRLSLVLALTLLAPQLARGTVASDALSDLASPVTTNAKWILIGGTVATTMAFAVRSDIEYRRQETFEDARPIGNFGFLGNSIGYGVLNASYVVFHGWRGLDGDAKSMRAAEHMFRATTYTLGTTLALKTLISERRPGYPDDDASFPSGHSSASFAFASVVAAQHGWVWGGVAHAGASFIAVSRINDDFHYLHDILAGITIGASYGWGVHYNLEKRNNYWFSLLPLPDAIGLAGGVRF